MKKALQASAGIRSLAAQALKVDKSTVTRFIQRHPEIVEFEKELADGLCDVAHGKLLQAIQAGEGWAIRYYLDHKGDGAGFGRKKVILATEPGQPLEVRNLQRGLLLSEMSEEQRNEVLFKFTGRGA
jgi:hypothetical protein